MILKKEIKKKKNNKSYFKKFLLLYFILTFVIGAVSFGIVINSVSFKIIKSEFLDKLSRSGRYEYVYLPKIAYSALKSNFSKFEKINLNIDFEDIIILEKLRKESLEKGELPPRNLLPKINLDLTHKEIKYRADARLKGDRDIHYKDKDNTSYKIEMKKNNYLFGVKKFSLQKPIVRNYIHEWIFHELAQEFGLIKLTYKFINLSINGDKKGLFVFEEGFGKELIERNKRRNGPIFGLDEDLNYSNINPVFEIYNKKFWGRAENIAVALSASQKLRDFFSNKLKAHEVFDLEKWASYFAIVDLTRTKHGALLKSVKFYYNPINGLFEPIPFDGHRFKPNFYKFNLKYENKLLIDFLINLTPEEEKNGLGWLRNFFFEDEKLNLDFYNTYIEKLTKISSKKFIQNFLSAKQKSIDKINSHIYADSFWYHNLASGMGLYYFSLDDFMYQAENIINKISNNKKFQVLQKSKYEFLIKNYSTYYDLIVLEKFICNDEFKKVEIKLNKVLDNFKDTIVNIPEILNKNLKCNYIKLSNKHSKNSILQKIDYINSNYNYDRFKNVESLKYGKYFYKKNQKLFLLKDKVIIDENLYIPKDLKVIIKAKQKITLINNAFIISNSPWVIGGMNGETLITGKKDNYGGGILVTDTGETSIIQNTKFSYLTGFHPSSVSEFIILGSINFHETAVKINNSKFENIYSEDALNIFRSKFEINKNNYKNISSDAIDIDFSNGKINSNYFENVKNDAIDFSGSNATVQSSYFKNINDKVISVGEKSKVIISNINAKNSHAGIISKDGSEVISDDIEFDGVLIPFAAYQKKKEYDYSSLIVNNYNIKNFHTKWLKDKGSNVIADNISLNINTKKILSIINDKKLDLINSKND